MRFNAVEQMRQKLDSEVNIQSLQCERVLELSRKLDELIVDVQKHLLKTKEDSTR